MIDRLGPLDGPRVRSLAFVTRCTGAAILSYAAANVLGLGHPIWAVVSALIVSQETALETRLSLRWRVLGTLVGIGAALSAAVLLMPDPERPLPAMSVAVAMGAVVARRWPAMRVCLWTAPLVLLTASSENSILHTALQRGSEVLLGGMIGAALHLLLDHAVFAQLRRWTNRQR